MVFHSYKQRCNTSMTTRIWLTVDVNRAGTMEHVMWREVSWDTLKSHVVPTTAKDNCSLLVNNLGKTWLSHMTFQLSEWILGPSHLAQDRDFLLLGICTTALYLHFHVWRNTASSTPEKPSYKTRGSGRHWASFWGQLSFHPWGPSLTWGKRTNTTCY